MDHTWTLSEDIGKHDCHVAFFHSAFKKKTTKKKPVIQDSIKQKSVIQGIGLLQCAHVLFCVLTRFEFNTVQLVANSYIIIQYTGMYRFKIWMIFYG